MKTKTIPSTWANLNGFRLDSNPYLSGAVEARVILSRFPNKSPLHQVTKGFNGGIYNGPQFARNYVDDPAFGVPFITSGSMLSADLSNLPLLKRKDAESRHLKYLRLEPGMTLISCSGTIGRMIYARPDMDGIWSSQDVMKVVPDPEKISPGYLYAYLSGRYGVPQVISGTYGAIIQHIEPTHIWELPVPRLGEIEAQADRLIAEAAQLRTDFQRLLNQATEMYFSSVGLRNMTSVEWHNSGRDLGFSSSLRFPRSLRALNFNPRYRNLIAQTRLRRYKELGEICREGLLGYGKRFKRVDCEPQFGVRLIGQRELFQITPEGRWVAPQYTPNDVYLTEDTILIAGQGTLGESEVFCRSQFITNTWLNYAYSEHFVRVRPSSEYSCAVVFAFLRSETAFRCMRSISTGSKQQSIHEGMLAEIPIPVPPAQAQKDIEALVRKAYGARHRADALESQAVSLVEDAIQIHR